MHPYLFNLALGPFHAVLSSYSALALLGMLLAGGIYFLAEPDARKRPVAHIAFLGTVMAASFLGAKAVQSGIDLILLRGTGTPFFEIISRAGVTVTGGIVFGTIAVFLYSAVDPRGTVTWRSVDALAAAFPFGHMAGRIGCFLAGCCYGRISPGSPFTVTYPQDWIFAAGSPGIPHGPRLASPLFEAAGLLLIGAVLVVLLRATRTRGQVCGLYFVLYGVLRFLVELTRDDPGRGIWGPLSTGQWFSLWAAAAGILLLLRYARAFSRGRAGPPFTPLNGKRPADLGERRPPTGS